MPTIDNQHDKNTPAPAEALSSTELLALLIEANEAAQHPSEMNEALAEHFASVMIAPSTGALLRSLRAALARPVPAQAAADAAGVLRLVALMAEAIQTADRLPEGSEDRRWAFTDYVNVESRLRRENPTRLRALADALEVQG